MGFSQNLIRFMSNKCQETGLKTQVMLRTRKFRSLTDSSVLASGTWVLGVNGITNTKKILRCPKTFIKNVLRVAHDFLQIVPDIPHLKLLSISKSSGATLVIILIIHFHVRLILRWISFLKLRRFPAMCWQAMRNQHLGPWVLVGRCKEFTFGTMGLNYTTSRFWIRDQTIFYPQISDVRFWGIMGIQQSFLGLHGWDAPTSKSRS